MDIRQTRRENLKILLLEALGSQKKLAEMIDTSPSYISQILSDNPSRQVGENLARRAEIAFKKPVGWMDNWDERKKLVAEGGSRLMKVISGVEQEAPRYGSKVHNVPELDIRASLGNGFEDSGEGGIIRTWEVDRDLLYREGIELGNAVLVSCVGQSMESTIYDEDIVLVDKGALSNFGFDPGVYALRTKAGIKIKRINIKLNGDIEVISDNSDKTKYPTETFEAELVDDLFEVVGRVVRKFWGKVI